MVQSTLSSCSLPTAHCPLLAAAFLSPWFFWAGLALIAIPVVIHILNRRRFKVVQWAAMEYLLQAMRKNRRRLKFEQWLLLAVRCCLLALLGLALARPLGCGNSAISALVGQRAGLHVFVIDNSYSMAYEADRPNNAKTHLDQAKLMATQMVDKLIKGGESVAVITAAHPSAAIVAKPSYSLDAVRNAIDGIEQSYGRTDLAGALQKAIEIGREETRQTSRSLYLLTDGTRSAFEGTDAESLRKLGPEAARLFKVQHFHLGRADQWNQAVLDLRPGTNLVTTKFNADFVTVVRGYGAGPAPVLQWRLDDAPLRGTAGAATVALDQNTPPQILANQRMSSGGAHVLSVSLAGDDRLKLDNVRNRIVEVASELKVLIVEGERTFGGTAGSGYFLEQAISPPKAAGDGESTGKTNSPFQSEVISELELGSKVLGQYQAVVLTNVGQIAEAEAEQLRRYVEQGGALMIFMGPRVNADNYNTLLLPRKLMPGKLIKQVAADAAGSSGFLFEFRPDATPSSFLAEFRGEANSGLGTSRVFTYWQCDLGRDSAVERVLDYLPPELIGSGSSGSTTASVAAKSPSRDPAITVHGVGQGRVLFFSTTANADWTSFQVKPIYVELMQELLSNLVNLGDRWMNLTVGQVLEVPASLGLTAAPTLLDPVKKEVALSAVLRDGATIYQSPPLSKPGIYSLSTGKDTYPIAVNVPPDEADVRTLAPAGVKKALGDIDLEMFEDQLPAETARLDEGRDLGWFFMVILLALVGLECFLAMRFGHYRRVGGAGAAAVPVKAG